MPKHHQAHNPFDPMRRRLLAGLGALAGGLSLPASAGLLDIADDAPPAGVFSRRLPIPALLDAGAGQAEVALTMMAGSSMLLTGVQTPTWGYNGSVLGPALRVQRGRAARVALHNTLPVATTTHWHGAHVPGTQDGGPQSPVQPGQTLRYDLRLDQPAATLWYHPHPDGRTGAHVWAGLAGLLLVDDGSDASLGLPRRWGVDDIPLILQDRRVDADGRLLYMDQDIDHMGMKGEHFLVNGCEQPYLEVPAAWVRLRLLNGSNARFYNLVLDSGSSFHAIASDAGLLAQPVALRSLLLGPGERAEILLDLRRLQGQALVLRSDSGALVPGFAMAAQVSDRWDRSGFDLLQLRVVGAGNNAGGRLPDQLATLPALPSASRQRRFTLQGMRGEAGADAAGTMPGMAGMSDQADAEAMQGMSGMSGMGDTPKTVPAETGPGGMSLGPGPRPMFSINDQFMDMQVINQRVALGASEIWEVANSAQMIHPFHLHGTSFRLLSRNGQPAPAHEQGWKDVVSVRPSETVRLQASFAQRADDAHPFMYHCHILEHEDAGMMGQFTVS